jgi:hypothetical protein
MPLPWIAVEYVHGGIEGATLEQRVAYACETTGFAFDPVRAAHSLRCLGGGLAAIHEVGVVHRDVTPGNVLCCGFGEFEVFKISDFGLARMQSFETFGDLLIGTPGYAPPEQNFPEERGVGPYTDVFSLACVAYYVLTGEHYFDVMDAAQSLLAVRSPKRRSVLEASLLSPELRAQTRVCRQLDELLTWATAYDPKARPQAASELTGALTKCLSEAGGQGKPARAGTRLVQSVLQLPSPLEVRGWRWALRHPPGDDLVLHAVAWESDGHCVAAASTGLLYWTGTGWKPAPTAGFANGARIRSVRRVRAGTWVLGGDEAVALYSSAGVHEMLRCPGASFQHASGHLDDLFVAVSDRSPAGPDLWTLAGRRWLPPLPLGELVYVSDLARIGANEWLIGGRKRDGTAGLVLARPLERSLSPVTIPSTRAIVACASQPERELGIAVGTDGVTVSVHPGGATNSVISGAPDLSACAADILDRQWAASAGHLWVKEPGPAARWRSIWEDVRFVAPFVSIMADVGIVLAITADGGVLEGRAPWSGAREADSSNAKR